MRANQSKSELSLQRRPLLRPLLLILLATLLLATACGGEEEAPATTAEEEAPPAEETEALETEPADEPTVAPATATTRPTATSLPPTETSLPPTPTATTEPDPADTVALPDGSCANRFFPVRPDAVWHYRTDSAGETISYTIAFETITVDSFVSRQTVSEVTSETGWACTAEGLAAQQAFLLDAGALGGGFEFEAVDSYGVTLPPADAWEPGLTWQNGYTLTGDIATGDTSMSTSLALDYENEIAGQEAVTTPAGTFPDAMRVDTTGTVDFMAEGMGGAMGGIEINYSNWYAPGVGLVRSVSENETMGGSTMELLRIEE